MSNYRVAVGARNYSPVYVNGEKQYKVGVSYQVPSRSIQYLNEILDNFSSQFDGNETIFPLTVNGIDYFPNSEQQLIISLNDVILEPKVDYLISGNTIVFTNPPTLGSAFFGVAMATTADLTRTINFVVESGSFDMDPGVKGEITLDVTGTIDSWTIIADQPGILILDIKKAAYHDYPDMTSITGTEQPFLGVINGMQQRKNKDEDLTTWNRVLNAGDILQYEVVAVSNIKRFLIALKLQM